MPSPSRPRLEAPPPDFPDRTLWVNGRIVRAADATLSLFDRGARDGEGLFETIRVEQGRPIAWPRHLERLVLAAAELGFPVPPAPGVLRSALDEALYANALADAAARITVTRGIAGRRPTRAGCWIDVEPLVGRLWHAGAGWARAIFSAPPFVPGPFGRYKTTSRLAYQLAREEARTAQADEALLVSPDGEVLEGATSNVFAVLGDAIVTPPLTRGILPGVTRARVIQAAAALGLTVREAPLPRALVLAADAVFLTNALQGVASLTTLENRTFAETGVAHRIAAALPGV